MLANFRLFKPTYKALEPRLLGDCSVGIITLQAPLVKLACIRDDRSLNRLKDPRLSRSIEAADDQMQSGFVYELSAQHFWDNDSDVDGRDLGNGSIFAIPLISSLSPSNGHITVIAALLVRKTGDQKSFVRLGVSYIMHLGCRALDELDEIQDARLDLHVNIGKQSRMKDAILKYNAKLVERLEAMDTEVINLV